MSSEDEDNLEMPLEDEDNLEMPLEDEDNLEMLLEDEDEDEDEDEMPSEDEDGDKDNDRYDDIMFELVAVPQSGKCSLCNNEAKEFICLSTFEIHIVGESYVNKKACDICLSTFEHLSTCMHTVEQPCLSDRCARGREQMMHLKDCNKRIDGRCERCSQIWVGMIAHASHFKLPNCKISYCRNLSEFKMMAKQ